MIVWTALQGVKPGLRVCGGGLVRRTIGAQVRPAAQSPRPTLRMLPRTSKGKGGDARLQQQMPWIFRNEVSNVEELRALGRTAVLADVESSDGVELGVALCNLAKGGSTGVNIIGRMLSDNVTTEVNSDFFALRIRRALEHRERLLPGSRNYRLINGEGDFIPGVLCDRYEDVLCVQFTALAAEVVIREALFDALEAVLSPRAIIVRYDVRDDRALETAAIRAPEVARGSYAGLVEIVDGDFVFQSDLLAEGWSSGAYFAERQLRSLVLSELDELRGSPMSAARHGPKGSAIAKPTVLSFFGESMAAVCAAQNVQATCVLNSGADHSRNNLESLASRNSCLEFLSFLEQLGPEPRLAELKGADNLSESFDVVTLEPPALAPTYGRLEEGARLYSNWTALAASLTKPGGLLLVVCRSRTMSAVRLLRSINLGIWSTKRRAKLEHRSAHAGFDFPVHCALPDTNQLQIIGLRVL